MRYNESEIEYLSEKVADKIVSTMNLDNVIALLSIQDMTNEKLRQRVVIDGEVKWLSGNTQQAIFDQYRAIIEAVNRDRCNSSPSFIDYLKDYYSAFKRDQQSNTIEARKNIIKNYVIPMFGERRICDITVTECQKKFDEAAKTKSKETLLKVKNVMSPVFDAAVEDKIIQSNPLKSSRFKVNGRACEHHKAIPKEKMLEIKSGLLKLKERERLFCALLCYTGMRLEEVLGLRMEDYDGDKLFVNRAVVHPTRNKPEIKEPKTKSSKRVVPVVAELKAVLDKIDRKEGFIIYGENVETPLSYTEARRSFDKIRKKFGLHEYTAHDFRDTCATEWRENGMPLDVIARLLGHSKTSTTEQRYVKYRNELIEDSVRLMSKQQDK